MYFRPDTAGGPVPARPCRSAPAEAGRALLEERPHALAVVVALEAREDRARRTAATSRSAGSRASSRSASFALRSVSGAFSAIAAASARTSRSSSAFANTAFTSPRRSALARVVAPRGEEDLLRRRRADETRERVEARHVVAEAEPRGGDREHRVVRRVAEVRAERGRHAAADAEAVDHREERLAEARERVEGARGRAVVLARRRRRRCARCSNSEMSAPDTKARSPAPRSTTTRTDGSASSSATAPGIACHIAVGDRVAALGVVEDQPRERALALDADASGHGARTLSSAREADRLERGDARSVSRSGNERCASPRSASVAQAGRARGRRHAELDRARDARRLAGRRPRAGTRCTRGRSSRRARSNTKTCGAGRLADARRERALHAAPGRAGTATRRAGRGRPGRSASRAAGGGRGSARAPRSVAVRSAVARVAAARVDAPCASPRARSARSGALDPRGSMAADARLPPRPPRLARTGASARWSLARRGMVCASVPEAAAAGVAMLARGGNAIDAAIAAAAVLCVVEPMMTGLGGDAFALFWSARGAAPRRAQRERPRAGRRDAEAYRARGLTAVPATGILSVTVPGAVHAWETLSRALRAPPARRRARARDPRGRRRLRRGRARRALLVRGSSARACSTPPRREHFAPDGRTPRAGEWFRVPALGSHARAPSRSAARRPSTPAPSPTRSSALRARPAATSRTRTSRRTTSTLGRRRSRRPTAASSVAELPPNGQGLAALVALNVLECLEPADPASALHWHRRIEAVKLAFADRDAFVADPEHADVPVAALLDKAYARRRARADRRARARGAVARAPERHRLPLRGRRRGEPRLVHPEPLHRVRLGRRLRRYGHRAAEPRRRASGSSRATGTCWRRGSGRSTRSSPACCSAAARRGSRSARWAGRSSRRAT